VLLIYTSYIYESVVQNNFLNKAYKIGMTKNNFNFIYTFRQCYFKLDINNFI